MVVVSQGSFMTKEEEEGLKREEEGQWMHGKRKRAGTHHVLCAESLRLLSYYSFFMEDKNFAKSGCIFKTILSQICCTKTRIFPLVYVTKP